MCGQIHLSVMLPPDNIEGKQIFTCDSELFPELEDKQWILISVDEWKEISEKLKEIK